MRLNGCVQTTLCDLNADQELEPDNAAIKREYQPAILWDLADPNLGLEHRDGFVPELPGFSF